MSFLRGLRWRSLIQLGPFHRGAVDPWRAARVGAGVLTPLALGYASGHVEYGAFAALGALPAGFASFQGMSRSRDAAVVGASFGMALFTFIGAILAGRPWLLLPVVIIYGYLTGLMVCLGSRPSVVVLQWGVGLMIAVGLPLPPAQAAVRAALVLAGGLLQAALVAGTWAVRPGASERASLAASYRALGEYADRLAAGTVEAPPPIAFPAVATLADANPLLPVAARLMLVDLLEEAERIRASLAALAATDAGNSSSMHRDQWGRLCADAAGSLELVAETLDARPRERPERIRNLGLRAAELTVAPEVAWRWAGEALLGQLRAVVEIMSRLDAVPTHQDADAIAPTDAIARPSPDDGIAAAIVGLRANLTLRSEAGRHALRLAAVAGLAEVLVHASGLPSGRWVVLTIFLVLKPDYASTLSRSVHRAVGTALGALLGLAAVQLGHLGQGGLIVAAGASVAAAYAVFDANYLVYSVCLTSFIIVLLDIVGVAARASAEARLIDTAIGSVLAVVAFLAWPTREGLGAPEKFARLLEAHQAYLLALLRRITHPSQMSLDHLRALQQSARRARSDAEASAIRLASEPPHPPLIPEVAGLLIAAMRRFTHGELALHALVAARRGGAGPGEATAPPLDALAAALGATMSQLALSLRTLKPTGQIPPLRRLQAELREGPLIDPGLLGVTDGLVDAINTIDTVLREKLPSPANVEAPPAAE